MKKSSRIRWGKPLLLPAIVMLAVTACTRDGDLQVIKLGHGLDTTHPVHQAMVFMADRVIERSSGRLRIDIYPGEQLGSERECIELLQIGSLGMTKVSSSALEGFVPTINVLGLPYLFRDEAHRFAVLEGSVGRRLLLDAEPYWLRGLCFYDAGSRSFYTKEKPVMSPADLKGYKIRTQESPTAMAMVEALGGAPTPIAWGELYTALQQGVVDGAENNPPSFYLSRHYEVCKYYALDEHTAVPDMLLVSTRIWNDLSPGLQAILQEAADASAQHQKTVWKQASQEALEAVQAAGVTVLLPNKKAFAEKVAPMYRAFESNEEMRQIIEQIKAVP